MFTPKVSPFNAPSFDIFAPARRHDDRGVIMGVALDGGQSYVPWIGLSTIRELALKHSDKVGLVDAERHEHTVKLLMAVKNRVLELEQERDALEAQQARIAGLIKDGFKVAKIQGRPRKEEN